MLIDDPNTSTLFEKFEDLSLNLLTSNHDASFNNVDICGNLSIANDVDISGDLNVNGGLTINNSFGISGEILTSQGNSAPIWSSPSTEASLSHGTVSFSKQSKGTSQRSVPTNLTAIAGLSFTATLSQGEVAIITGTFTLYITSNPMRFYHLELRRDTNTVIATYTANIANHVSGSEYHTFSFQFIDRPSNGSRTYSFYHKAAASGLYLFGQRSNASVTYEYRPNMTFTADNWT